MRLNTKAVWQAMQTASAALFLGLCLFGAYGAVAGSSLSRAALGAITSAMLDERTQWMLVVCAAVYFVTFFLLSRRPSDWISWQLTGPDVWLVGAVLIGVFAYFLDYAGAPRTTQALALVGGAALGKGARLCAGLRTGRSELEAGSWKFGAWALIAVIIVLLLGAAVWQPETGHFFQYRGQARWTGP